MDAALMPIREPWDAAFELALPELDAQHRELLALSHRMADVCDGAGGNADAAAFDTAFAAFQTLVREHVALEAAELARRSGADADALHDELDEFEAVVDDIATTENFDRLELQRFVGVWTVGHLVASAQVFANAVD